MKNAVMEIYRDGFFLLSSSLEKIIEKSVASIVEHGNLKLEYSKTIFKVLFDSL